MRGGIFMRRYFKSFVGYLLTASLVFSHLSVLARAEESIGVTEEVVSSTEIVDVPEESKEAVKTSEIVCELVEKRDEMTKHFAMTDGTIKAYIYPQNVHYMENGKYEEIDNTLVKTEEGGKTYYKNKKNDFTVKMPEAFTDDYIEFSDENGYVSFKLLGATNKKLSKIEKEQKSNRKNDITIAQNVNDRALFKSVKGDVDIQYDLEGNKLKETIVLYKKTKNSFAFDVQTSATTAKVNADNSISFFNAEGVELYVIASPYMTDSLGEYSNAIETNLIKGDNGYTLTYTPDYEWLSAKEREYPVKIDPTLFKAIYKETVTDTYVSNVQTSNNPDIRGGWDVLNIGRRKTKLSNGEQLTKRGLIRFDIPSEIGKNDCIVDAKLDLVHYTVSSAVSVNGIQIDIHELTSGFAEGSTWWGNQPSYNPTIIDYAIVNTSNKFSGTSLSYDSYNVTKLVNKWHNGDTNYGILLKLHDENTTVTSSKQVYYFAKQSVYYGNVSKFVEITYRNATGIEDYWSYTTQDFGSYGTGYINNYNGNLVYAHNDVTYHSLINEVTLTHIYNANLVNNGSQHYGNGWGLNLIQKLEPVTITGNSSVKYVYTDGDGTKHYLVQISDGRILDEDGLGLVFKDIDEGELQYQLKDKQDNILKFDKWYYLRQIIDANGNTIYLNYDQATDNIRLLNSITTSSGGSITLIYNSDYQLTQISDNSERITHFWYSEGNLIQITYPDGKEMCFAYTNHRVSGITLPDNQCCEYSYDARWRVVEVANFGRTSQEGQKITLEYGYNQTTVSDIQNRRNTYQFDTFGRAICIYDEQQNIYSQSYTQTTNGTNIFQNNKLSLSSNGAVYVNNLLRNPVFSDGFTQWTQNKNHSGAEITIVTDQGLITSNSAKITSSEVTSASIRQSPVISTERTYTLSGYLKTQNVQSQTSGAGLEIVVADGENSRKIYSDFILGTTDEKINNGFQCVSITVTLEDDETIQYIGAGLYDGTGMVWIDSMQLEEGYTANTINLLGNSSFEIHSGNNSLPTECSANFTPGVNGGISMDVAHDGSSSLRISGIATVKRYAWFTVRTSGKAGDVYSLGGWAKANAVANHSSNGVVDFKLTAGVYYTTGEYVEFPIDLNENVTDWQYVMKPFIPEKDYDKILVYGSYNFNCNEAYFDSFFLYRDTAQSYQYDESGNVISTADYAKQQSAFDYSDNNLSKLIQPNGTRYSYKYDDKNNLINANSDIGVSYNVAYDETGNAVETTILAEHKNVGIEDGKTYYIRNKNSGLYLSVEGEECIRSNVYQRSLNEGAIQRWTVKELPNDHYIIRPEGCNEHALSFENRYIVNTSANLSVTGENVENIDWSHWTISPNYDIEGSYKIITSTNAYTKYLTAANVSLEGYSDVYMDYVKETDVQKWLFVPVEQITESANEQNEEVLEEKTYYICNKNSGLYLSAEGDECVRAYMCQQPMQQATLQKWTVKKLSNGYYILRPQGCNEHALGFENRYTPNTPSVLGVTGANVENYDWTHWILSPNNDVEGSYKIITSTSAYTRYLTVANASTEAGGSVYMDYSNTSDSQKWFFVPVEEIESTEEGTTYYIRNQNSGQYLTIEGDECARANVYQQPLKEDLLQRWTVKKLTNGYYIIRPEGCKEHALGFLSRYEENTNVNIGVTGRDVEDIDWSHWILTFNNDSDGSYKIITRTNACTRYLSVTNSSLAVGGNVYMDYKQNAENQNWLFIPTAEQITSSATYQDNGNYLHTVTDERGNVTTYDYDVTRGVLTAVEDANGNRATYAYNDLNDYLESVSQGEHSVSYTYETSGAVKKISTANGTQYQFTYDEFGRQDTISVGARILSDITYLNNYTSLVSRMDYGNGVYKNYSYDVYDRLISESVNGQLFRTYLYDKRGNIAQIRDNSSGIISKYQYDLIGRIIGISQSDGQKAAYVYDDYNRLSAFKWSLEDIILRTQYIYGNSNVPGQNTGLIYGVKLNDEQKLTYVYDSLGRLSKRTINTVNPYATTYEYSNGAKNGTTTTLVDAITNGDDTYSYLYDGVGNITRIEKNGTVISEYAYDGLNQLISAIYNGDTYTYAYDNGGNITEIKKNGVVIQSYTYGDNEWKDLLTGYNGETITYDAIGNPLTYRDGMNFTWENGRQLAGVTKNGVSVATYDYNADGLRTSKTVNGTITEYYWLEGILHGQKTGNEYIIFLYDEVGNIYGFVIQNGTQEAFYYYEFNLQGDIIGIIDSNGTKVVEYIYDAWGNLADITGSHADTIGQKNPMRYRGYYYDDETGFYYLRSRYYDPEIGRFLNADGLVAGIGGDVRGYNIFAYCMNNPVNMTDSNGNLPKIIQKLWSRTKNAVKTMVKIALSPLKSTKASVGAGMGLGLTIEVPNNYIPVAVEARASVTDHLSYDKGKLEGKNSTVTSLGVNLANALDFSVGGGKEHSYKDCDCVCSFWHSTYKEKSDCVANRKIESRDAMLGVTLGAYLLLGAEISVGIDMNAWGNELISIFNESLLYKD